MSITNRPYAGTWNPQGRRFVKYTPDCLVYFNGDTSLPGCGKCSGRIDLQQFIINVSVDSGVQPGASSATVSLSIPREFGASLFRDNNFILQMGLEVHIYMRGYFPQKNLYNAEEPRGGMGSNLNLSEAVIYPYYHVFHGVVINVNTDYGGGFYNANITCGSMLHFWQYQPITTNAAFFGARPENSKMRSSLVGHNYTAMTPFSIIYSLYRDTMGSPAGVNFTFGQKTNIAASNPVNPDQSLFSVAQLYWERRFATRINNLRLYGASGTLFNSAQQAFISKLSTRQVERIVANQYKDRNSWPDDPKNPFYAAIALDLIRYSSDGKLVKPLDVSLLGRSAEPDQGRRNSLGINVAAIQAYVSDIGAYGNVNLFESTYENKLDIANRVAQVTGFEFFQDVDGDFVFKPPFYNLDTSSSRVYQVKPIDTISFATSEKEPQVTYMKAKGNAFKNQIVGAGLENEYGPSGSYYDYRLIAKYGWRPGSFETAYLNNGREIFWAAVNRMDLMNASINSATASIPLRPELRPGMPVYIEDEDCYYYLNGFSHSFQFGGQCTTSLTLEARRAKFYAPGDPRKSGVDSIDLSNMNLPKKALTVVDESGQGRDVGFPNVVMALDPTQVNPLFYIVGSDLENVSTKQFRENIINTLRASQGIQLDVSDNIPLVKDVFKDGRFVVQVDENNTIRLQGVGENNSPDRDIVLSQNDFRVAANRYERRRQNFLSKKGSIESDIEKLSRRLDAADKIADKARRDKRIESLNKQIEEKRKALQGAINKRQEQNNDKSIQAMLAIIASARQAYYDKNPSEIPNMNSTASLLDLLSSKKSAFNNSQIPGVYRYYSSSHPDPENQGQRILTMSESSGTPAQAGAIQRLDEPITNKGFIPNPSRRVGGIQPEAEFGQLKVNHGFNVLSPGKISNTKRVATRDITTLTFVQHRYDTNTVRTVLTPESTIQIPLKGLQREFKTLFSSIYKLSGAGNDITLGELWGGKVDQINEDLQTQLQSVLSIFLDTTYQSFLADPFYTYATSDVAGRNRTLGSIRGRSLKNRTNKVISYLSSNFANIIAKGYNALLNDIKVTFDSPNNIASTDSPQFIQRRDAAYESFNNSWNDLMLSSLGKLINIKKKTTRGTRRGNRKDVIYSPVFPVSDHKGYEVVGSYRYGRGLSIEPGGTFERLINDDDPLRFQDLSDVENLIQSLFLETIRTDEGVETTVRSNLSLQEKAKFASQLSAKDANGNPILLEDNAAATSPEATQFDVRFSNWIETIVNSSDKITVANAAFSLADLNSFTSQQICECRANEADIALPAFGLDAFLTIAPDSDRVAEYARDQAAAQEPDWKSSQDAMRGTVFDEDNRSLVDELEAYQRSFPNQYTGAFEGDN